MDPIVLCADSESLQHPEMIGLEGVRLDTVPWLMTCSRAEEARALARRAPMPQEFWIASADDMEAINVAAALKRDEPLRTVRLVVSDATGSVLSRAHAAQVDETLPLWRFAQRFRTEGQRRAVIGASASEKSPVPVPGGTLAVAGPATPNVALAPSQKLQGAAKALEAQAVLAGSVASTPLSDADRTLAMAPLVDVAAAMAPTGTGDGAFVISVVSGSGGAGKTTVALHAALLARARGHRTLLIDGDLQFGDLRAMLDRKNARTVSDVLEAPDPWGSLSEGDDELAFIAAPRKLEEAELCAPHLPRLVDAAAARFDVVVVDTGASWTDYHASLLERSNRTLFLIDQRATSVRACQHALDVCLRSGIATGSFLFALNRCSRHALFTSIDVSCALSGAHVVELKEGGSAVEEACGAGLSADLLRGKNDLCGSLDELLAVMLPERGIEGSASARSRGRSRTREGAVRGERRSLRKGKHGRRERQGAAEAVSAAIAGASHPVA